MVFKKLCNGSVFKTPACLQFKFSSGMIYLVMENLPPQNTLPVVAAPPIVPPSEPIQKRRLSPLKIGLFLLLLLILGLGITEVLGVTKLFFRLKTVTFLPLDTEFYLSIAVKDHPQAKAMSKLTDRFPGSKKIKERPGFFSRELLGTPKDPFEDIIKLADKEIFLAKLPDDKKPSDEDPNNFMTQPLEKLLNLVEMRSKKEADDQLDKFKTTTGEYRTATKKVLDHEILDISLISKSRDSEEYDIGGLPLNVTLPFSKQVFATGLDQFIGSSEKESDIKKVIEIFKTNTIFNSLQGKKIKTIQDDPDHEKIAKFFPEESFLTFYQHDSLEAFSNLVPSTAVTQSFLLGFDSLDQVEGEDSIGVKRGLAITAEAEGVRLNSLQLDWRTPEKNLINPYKIQDSIANRLPAKFSGLNPLVFAETKNFKQLYADQQQILKDAAKLSKNPEQKKHFENAIEGYEEFRKEFQKTFGVDPETDIFSWMDGQAAFIFNAGTKGKAPEFLFVADIKDSTAVEASLAKIQLPNYKAEQEQRFGSASDSRRLSDLRQLASALEAAYTYNLGNSKAGPPKSLQELVTGGYIRVLPKDPTTNELYKYTVSRDGKSAEISALLEDGRTAFYNTNRGLIEYRGVAKPKTVDTSPIKPVKIPYKDTFIHSLVLFEGADLGVDGFKYYLYFAVTDQKAVILFSDKAKSLQEIVDFESEPTTTLASLNTWQEQFGKVKKEVGGLVYIEPVQIYGLYDYYKDLSKSEFDSFNRTTEPSDNEVVAKSYLATLSSIGTYVTKEKPVYSTQTFVSVKEIKASEKEKAEKALERILDEEKRRKKEVESVRQRVQGAEDTNWAEYFSDLRDTVMPSH